MHVEYSTHDRRAAVEMYLAGCRSGEVAAETGCSKNTIINWMRECGHAKELRRPGHPTKLVPDSKKTEAGRLYRQGFSLRKIEAMLGISATAVRKALVAQGIPRRPDVKPRNYLREDFCISLSELADERVMSVTQIASNHNITYNQARHAIQVGRKLRKNFRGMRDANDNPI